MAVSSTEVSSSDRRNLADSHEIDQQIARIEARLLEDFGGRVSAADVSQQVLQLRNEFQRARITQFVPTLVESTARRRLIKLAQQA